MSRTYWIGRLIAPLALVATFTSAHAQGKGKSGDDKPDKNQGRGANQEKPGKSSKAVAKADRPDKKVVREVGGAVGRPDFRVYAASKKHGHRLAGQAVSSASRRGVPDDAFVITPSGRRVHVLNRSGVMLLDMDDDRDIGTWKVVNAKETGKTGAPSFCRSGAGHPVWGRQWCVDKGFGLGDDQGVHWGRAVGFQDVIFRGQSTADPLPRNVLLDVLGSVVFNRLATQAIALGYSEPLVGRWLGEPGGARVLLLSSGDRPVAEIVDANRDGRAELMIVALRP